MHSNRENATHERPKRKWCLCSGCPCAFRKSVCLSTEFWWWPQKQSNLPFCCCVCTIYFMFKSIIQEHFMIWECSSRLSIQQGKFCAHFGKLRLNYYYFCGGVEDGLGVAYRNEELILRNSITTEGIYRFNNLHRMQSVIVVAFKWGYCDWLKVCAWLCGAFFLLLFLIGWKNECDK